MNIVPNAVHGSLKQQRPTFLLAPNFATRPFPKGPFDLGTLVEDIKDFYPLNQGADNRVPIPTGERFSDVKEDFRASVNLSRTGEAGLLARVLDQSIAGNVRLKGQKSDEDVYWMQRLETVYFYPQHGYIKKCLQLPDVREYLEMSSFKAPVYLITGLKIAWGATISTERGRSYHTTAEGSITVPGAAGVGITSKAGLAAASDVSSSFSKPADFVLGIQVQKIYHKRKFLSGERVLTTERVRKNAVLVDNDELEMEEDADADFVIANLDETNAEGLVSWTQSPLGQDSQREDWLVPSDTF